MNIMTGKRLEKGRENAQKCRKEILKLLAIYKCCLRVNYEALDWEDDITVVDDETLEEADGGL